MKVLLQEWMTEDGYKMSISKDQDQLDATIAELKAKDRGEPQGKAMEVKIDEDADGASESLAEMVEGDTIFLNKDEEDLVIYPE